MADCLSTPLILREIFQYFSSTELLQLSLVNKQWNYEARSLVRNRGDLTARVNKNGTGQELRAFASDLQRMIEMKKVIPFTGLNIAVGGCRLVWINGCAEPSTGELDHVNEDMLDQMSWKHLKVSFKSPWVGCERCQAFLLVRKVFQKYCCVLEELSLQVEHERDCIQAVLPGCSFPRLKILKIQKGNMPRPPNMVHMGDTFLIKAFVSVAPNLQVLHTEHRVDLNANLLVGSSAVHLTNYVYFLCPDNIPESVLVLGELRMQRMKLDRVGPQFSIERFNRITPTLLQNSQMTLRSMEIAPMFLVPLMRYGISLENFRTLVLTFTADCLEFHQPLLWRLVKSFDFKRFFPNLSTIHISWVFNSLFSASISASFNYFCSVFSDMMEQENAALVEPMLDRAENIKSLRRKWDLIIWDRSTQLLAQMLPDVQKRSIRSTEIPFTSIWDSWLDLKELDIIIDAFSCGERFDSAFCGIFPEEIAQLQEQDEEYLRRVNIVPVMPSITGLKGLRTLNMTFAKLQSYEVKMSDDPTRVLSKVTCLIAFQRLPALTVNLKTNHEGTKEALRHLEPYVPVVLGKILATD